MSEDYQVVNRASWDERAPAHAAAPEYAVELARGRRLRDDRG